MCHRWYDAEIFCQTIQLPPQHRIHPINRPQRQIQALTNLTLNPSYSAPPYQQLKNLMIATAGVMSTPS